MRRTLNTAIGLAMAGLLVFAGISGCRKENVSAELTVEAFVAKTKSLISSKQYRGLAREIDFSTTRLIHSGPNQFFHTDLKANGQFARALISIVRPDNKVFHYIIVVDKVNDTHLNNHLYTLAGNPFGSYRIVNGKVDTKTEVQRGLNLEDPGTIDGIEEPVQSEIEAMIDEQIEDSFGWWGCTRECISDCHIACYYDKECATMLIVTNLGASFVSPKGAGGGSLAIGISCGIACAVNSNMDLLPQY